MYFVLTFVVFLKIQEYDKQKNEREMAFEKELKEQKMMKDKEIAKIQANQKASQDLQAAKDELNAIRTQNKVSVVGRKMCVEYVTRVMMKK